MTGPVYTAKKKFHKYNMSLLFQYFSKKEYGLELKKQTNSQIIWRTNSKNPYLIDNIIYMPPSNLLGENQFEKFSIQFLQSHQYGPVKSFLIQFAKALGINEYYAGTRRGKDVYLVLNKKKNDLEEKLISANPNPITDNLKKDIDRWRDEHIKNMEKRKLRQQDKMNILRTQNISPENKSSNPILNLFNEMIR